MSSVWSRVPHVKKVDVAINKLSADHMWLSLADYSVRTPCINKDCPCRPKTESSHPCPVEESSETRLVHPSRYHNTKCEVPPCTLKSRQPYNREAHEILIVIPVEDRFKDAWIAAAWKQWWEASGPTRVQSHVSDPGEDVQGDDSKQTTNWERPLQIINEEVRTDNQCSM